MTNHSNSYIEIGPGAIDRSNAIALKLTELGSLSLGMIKMAVAIDLLSQSIDEADSKSRHTLCLQEPSMLTDVEHEALNRVLHKLSQVTGITAELRFRANSDWRPKDPEVFKANDIPFISSAVITTDEYLEEAQFLKDTCTGDPINYYLVCAFTYALALIQASNETYDDAHLVHVLNQLSFMVDQKGYLLYKAIILIELVLNEISETCKSRFELKIGI